MRVYARAVEVDLSAVDAELVEHAERLISARSDGYRHTVAASARAADGRIVDGVNLYHFTGGPCAEVVALSRAATEGIEELQTIVAVGDGGRGILSPCGRCRQVLLDYSPDISAILLDGSSARAVPITDLLPWEEDPRIGRQP